MFYNAVFRFILDDSGIVDLVGISGVSSEAVWRLSKLEPEDLSLHISNGVDMFHNKGTVGMFRGGVYIEPDRASIVITGHYSQPTYMKSCHLSRAFPARRLYG